MTRDDILAIARQAGSADGTTPLEKSIVLYAAKSSKFLEKFAALIANKEREACAKLCDEIAIDMWNLYKGRPPYKGDEEGRASDFTQGRSAGADDCAEAIRKRSNT